MGWMDNFNASFGVKPNEDIGLPSGSAEDTRYWIYYAWGQLREHDSSIPDDVLDFIRDAALSKLKK